MKAVYCTIGLANNKHVYMPIWIYIGLYVYTRIHVAFCIFVPTLSQSCESQHLRNLMSRFIYVYNVTHGHV